MDRFTTVDEILLPDVPPHSWNVEGVPRGDVLTATRNQSFPEKAASLKKSARHLLNHMRRRRPSRRTKW
jgi:hypothetical protein